ncbi:MAG: NlpC/P60 family protein [Hyphomicrobiaceae bacterium]|nr:NlpC/P60 family protein [Hyphomicrobiaceae bacterium]
MTTQPLDPRRNAFRPDLADESLRGRVAAGRFVMPQVRLVVHASTPLRDRPDPRASWTTEALFGEVVKVLEDHDGWSWVQLQNDGYVGYMRSGALSPYVTRATHRVRALGTFVYPEPEVKAPPIVDLPMNAEVCIAEEGLSFCRLHDGSYIPARHIAPVWQPLRDFVDVAERFLGVPYLWGGKSRLGLDCSGLVQVALQACGVPAPRDSDMQGNELGAPVDVSPTFDNLQRGDLVFWRGHVGLLLDAFTLLHANAHHMCVAEEPFLAAVERIARGGSRVIGVRRMRQVA